MTIGWELSLGRAFSLPRHSVRATSCSAGTVPNELRVGGRAGHSHLSLLSFPSCRLFGAGECVGGCHFGIPKLSSEPRQSPFGWMAHESLPRTVASPLGWMACESLPRIAVVVVSCDETNANGNRQIFIRPLVILMLTIM